MCDPVSIGLTTAAVSGASSVMGFMGQNQAANANRQAAGIAYGQTANQVGQRNVEIDRQQSENTMQATIDRVAGQGRVSASASAGGADEATAARGAAGASFTANRGLGIENINSENQRAQSANDMTNAWYRRQSQINSVLPASPLSLALNLAKAGLSGADAFGATGGKFGGTHPDASAPEQDSI